MNRSLSTSQCSLHRRLPHAHYVAGTLAIGGLAVDSESASKSEVTFNRAPNGLSSGFAARPLNVEDAAA
ncbi:MULTISPECIES: hypothetical protein [unclassified Bradyrhizobium]|uniref:hypothetical protein n=1 Tax=unclassified Bradyrhizobium TaxID=2631580 RepID=UPI0028EE8A09|nr:MULTISPECIES: hypothetical protein [unclassified Bradyrhizobium]